VQDLIVKNEDKFLLYEITDYKEKEQLSRLFKQFYFKTIEVKYGYLKANVVGVPELNP
jgi:hypothetical protein